MRVVELADEFGATTAETLDWCAAAGVPAADGGTELTDEQCARIRAARSGAGAPAAGPGGPPPPAVSAPTGPGPFVGAPSPGPAPFTAPPPGGHGGFAGAPPGPGPAAGSFRPGGPGAPPPATTASPPGSGLAMLALIAALISICVPVVPAVVAIVAGTVAKRSAATSPVRSQATGRGTAAQAIGVITIVLWLGLYGLVYKSSHTTATLKDGTTVSVQKVLPKEIGSSDCYVTQQDALVKELYVADCAGPHDAEIFAGALATFSGPGTDLAVEECQEIARRRGVTADDVRVSVLSSGDNLAGSLCVARHNDGRPYSGRLVNP